MTDEVDFDTETDTKTDTEFGADTAFIWPTKPPEDWWLTQGAAVGLDNDQIRFSAALFSLGGVASKKNTRAARAAGLDWDRLQAFRVARSATVGRLLDEARQISEGKREPLSEEEIDWRIDNLIRSPDSLMVARGIELREKRKAAKLEARQAHNERLTIEETYRQLLKSWGPYGAPALCEMWAPGTGKPTYLWGCPFLPQLLPVIGKRFPELLSKYRDFFKRRADAFPGVKWEQERLRLFDLWASAPEPSLEELAAALAKDGEEYSKFRAVG